MEMVDSVDNLKTSQSIGGHRFPNFEMVDAKIASALKKIISNPYCKTRVNLEKQKGQMQDRLLRVRQIAKVLRTLTSDWSTTKLFLIVQISPVSLYKADDIQVFDIRWH